MKQGQGTLIVYRRPKESQKPWQYIPCEHCLMFIHDKGLSTHMKTCGFATENSCSKNYLRNGLIMIQPFLTHRCQEDKTLERELKQIIHNMRETTKYPDLKRTCENDTLIKEFGLTLLLKIGPKEEQRRKHENNISTKLRAVARLVKESLKIHGKLVKVG